MRLAVAAACIFLAGILQNTNALLVVQVKPNLVLALLAVFAFFISDWIGYLILIFISGLTLRFQGGLDIGAAAVTVTAILIFALRNKFPGARFVDAMLAVVVGTLAFYAIAHISLFRSDPLTIFIEMVYNSIVGAGAYLIASQFLVYEKGFRTSR